MNVFWQDPEGKFPPEDAVFSTCPFLESTPKPIGTVNLVKELPKPKTYKAIKKTFSPTKDEWIELLNKTTLPKVVLARCCTLEFEEEVDPFAVTASLQKKTKNSTLFCFAGEHVAFLGATPEVLFKRKRNEIYLEAVAGTRLLHEDAEEFLSSKKDLSEVKPVIEYLQKNLESVCQNPPMFTKIGIKKTPNLMHLHAEGVATLNKASDRDVIEQIHPTPALCGLPKKQAMDWIRAKEPFSRGLYGGTLGWSTPDESNWIVAIRCCKVEGKTVKLYTGAGIVPLSDPEGEWRELNNKMALYEDIFESNLDY